MTASTEAPAVTLRRAAAKLRELATAASTDDDGTPTADWNIKPCWPEGDDDGNRFLYGGHLTRDDGRRISWPNLLHGGTAARPPRMRTQHAEYAAAMDPSIGLVLADWLDAVAAEAERHAAQDPSNLAEEITDGHPITVALAVLGETS